MPSTCAFQTTGAPTGPREAVEVSDIVICAERLVDPSANPTDSRNGFIVLSFHLRLGAEHVRRVSDRRLVEVAVSSLRNEGISAGSYVTFLKGAALNVRSNRL